MKGKLATLEALSRSARYGLFALLALHIVLCFHTPKGHFTDSYLYYLEAESVVERGELALDVGYRQNPSPALELEGARVHDGELYSKYPSFYSLIAAPFLALFGEAGLFYLNGLALVGAVLLTLRIAGQFGPGGVLGAYALAILLGGTFFWYYSQAIWPHMLQVFLVLGASWAAIRARHGDDPWSWATVGSGALLGLAIGVRLDSVFMLPALGALFLVSRTPWRKSAGLLLGLVPFLALLAWLNHVKFGQATPFTYGLAVSEGSRTAFEERNTLSSTYFLALLPVLFLCSAFVARFGDFRQRISARAGRYISFVLVAFAALCLLLIGSSLARGAGVLLFDMRLLVDVAEPRGMSRSAGNAVIYAGHLKKALIQSAPFLPLSLLPLVKERGMTGESDRVLRYWLYLAPATFAIVFSSLRWHGAMSLDMRYFLPVLPFLAILTGIVVRELVTGVSLRRVARTRTFLLVVIFLALLLLVAARQRALPMDLREHLFLTAPLVLSTATLLFVARVWLRGESLSRRGVALLCLPILWGGPVMISDYDRLNEWRSHQEEAAARFAVHITEGSLVLGYHQDLFSKTRNVSFASLRDDSRAHLPELVGSFSTRGRAVFLIDKTGEIDLSDLSLSEYRSVPLAPYWLEAGMREGGLYRIEPKREVVRARSGSRSPIAPARRVRPRRSRPPSAGRGPRPRYPPPGRSKR